MVSFMKFVWFALWMWHQVCFVFRLVLLILWQCKRITCKLKQYIFMYTFLSSLSPVSFSFSLWQMEYHKSAIVSWDIETVCLETTSIYPQGFSNEVTKALELRPRTWKMSFHIEFSLCDNFNIILLAPDSDLGKCNTKKPEINFLEFDTISSGV